MAEQTLDEYIQECAEEVLKAAISLMTRLGCENNYLSRNNVKTYVGDSMLSFVINGVYEERFSQLILEDRLIFLNEIKEKAIEIMLHSGDLEEEVGYKLNSE